MTTVSATVRNEYGIHCRPSAIIVKECQGYPGEIRVRTEDAEADPRHLMDLIGLGISCGTTVKISVAGPNEEETAHKMAELFERDFDFPR